MKRELLFGYSARRCASLLIAVAIVGSSVTLSTQAQSITWLGVIDEYSTAWDVSWDGTVVVGTSNFRAFRWQNGVMQALPLLDGFVASDAYGVSADGSVVVGQLEDAGDDANRAFRWQNGQMQNLGVLPNSPQSKAFDVSADGSVVVGFSGFDAFRWQNGQMQSLGIGQAWAVSSNGLTVVGQSSFSNALRAARWQNNTVLNLGTLPGYTQEGRAQDVSDDGSIIVGYVFDSGMFRAFRWQNGQMQDLGSFGGNTSSAWGVTADGLVVVGGSSDSTQQLRAFRWTQQTQMQDLNQVYASLLTDGSRLWVATSISPDGRYIVGSGFRNNREEGFLIDTWRAGDTSGDGCVDDADLLAVLFEFGGPGSGITRHEDVNKDGIVDDADLLAVLFAFGEGCGV